MEIVTGYFKYKHHIITIETYLDNHDYNKSLYIVNPAKASYKTNYFKIISIEHITGYNVDMIDEYEINKKYNKEIKFVLEKNIAFCYNFIIEKEYELFENGYSGYYIKYFNNGNIFQEFYHTNGKKQGIYKIYCSDGTLSYEKKYINDIEIK